MLQPVEITDYFRFMDLPPELRKMVYEFMLLETPPEKNVYTTKMRKFELDEDEEVRPSSPKVVVKEMLSIDISTYKAASRNRRPVRSGFNWHEKSAKRAGVAWDNDRGKVIGQEPSALALLRVSKQIFFEAAPIIYGEHRFYFDDVGIMECFLSTIGDNRHFLKHLEVVGYMSTKCRPAFKLLKDAKNLRTIKVSHGAVCDKKRLPGEQPVGTKFVSEILPMLKGQHELHIKGDRGATILDMFTVLDDTRSCYSCNRTYSTRPCVDMDCGYPCAGVEKHSKELVATFKTLVAGAVGLNEVKEGREAAI
ncbi:hypothetical protein LTR56_021978 [Elasticomyces elasticus]|nr:hypothetical protein LTR56_021978 [Elasticomyces elasticus]KAK3630234.1 hypothetical protein LTR22_021612 [Elasticomyces elasticus]KAK4920140.1 hypothetical protein LTR49_012239 [Elasticomyces elasticus]KAK5748965.1 hypothetical protein LTS12_021002 [Elasticomyces elasticus]